MTEDEPTLEEAQLLLDWAESRDTVILDKGSHRGWLLGDLDPQICARLIAQGGPESLHITTFGLAIDPLAVRSLLTKARKVQEAHEEGVQDAPTGPSDVRSQKTEGAPAPEQARPRRPRAQRTIRFQFCDPQRAQGLLAQTPDRQLERKRLLEQLAKRPERQLPIATSRMIDRVEALGRAYPNFEQAVALISEHLALAVRLRQRVSFPPLLLNGPPGIGKTSFAIALASAANLHMEIQSFAEVSAGFVLTGGSPMWSDGRPGRIARLLAALPDAKAPLLVIDELDKASRGIHAPDRSLLGALEPATACRFRDECLELEFDATPISWLLCSNQTASIRPEILSRMEVVQIPAPTFEQMRTVVQGVDAGLRRAMPRLARHFAPIDDAAVIDLLTRMPPRAVRRHLLRAYAVAARSPVPSPKRRLRVSVSHLGTVAATSDSERVPRKRQDLTWPLPAPKPSRVH